MNAMVVDDLRWSFVDPTVEMAYIYIATSIGNTSKVSTDLVTRLTMQLVTDRYGPAPFCAAVRNGHAEEVKLLLPLTNIENHFEDGLGQNPACWVVKSGCVEITNLVQQWARKLGFDICESDLSLRLSPVLSANYYILQCVHSLHYVWSLLLPL